MGFSRHATVSDHERDQAEVSEEVLARYATLYGTTVQELRYGVSRGTPSAVRERYGLADEDVAQVPGLGLALLRMPPDVYAMAYDFLADLEQAGVSRDAQDRVHVFLTHLATGHLTPGYTPRAPHGEHEDAVDAIAFLRRVFARRGIALALPAIDVSAPPDPDAISGAELERRLAAKQRKPKAG